MARLGSHKKDTGTPNYWPFVLILDLVLCRSVVRASQFRGN